MIAPPNKGALFVRAMIKKRNENNQISAALAKQLSLHEDVAAMLVSRGIDSVEKARAFFSFEPDMLLSAKLIDGMEGAVKRIKEALQNNEKILIFGDYDCDGIAAVAILKLYFESEGSQVLHYIPSRSDGYGLSEEALERIADEHFPDLIITVDCGITAIKEVEFARETLGIDVIVTDHHEPYDVIPDCIVVNPKLNGNSHLKDLCGAGVAFKLVEALAGRKKALEYVDLACLATIADVVPLIGENRLIVQLGLQKLNTFERLGIKLLARSVGAEKLNARDIAYRIAPRINAPSRMGNEALDIVSLFTSEEYFEVESVVEALNRDNELRQRFSERIYSEAIAELKKLRYENRSVIILHSSAWDVGVLGLVAARLAREFVRPAILLNSKGEYLRGSARSSGGVDLFACLSNCGNLLEEYGGHKSAAGLTLNIARLDALEEAIDSYIKSNYPELTYEPLYEYDIELRDKSRLNYEFVSQLELFEPTGEGNPQPIIMFGGEMAKPLRIGNTNHVKFRFTREAEGVAFNSPELMLALSGAEFYLFGRCARDTYKNRDYININIADTVVKNINALSDGAISYCNYLATLLHGADKLNARVIKWDKLGEEADTDATLFVAYSAESAKNFLHEFGEITTYFNKPKPCKTGLLIYPECKDYALFGKIVFLDAPLSTGFIAEIEKSAPETEFVYAAHYGFKSVTERVDITDEAINYTYGFILNCAEISVLQGDIETIYNILTKYGYQRDSFDFAAHFIILLDTGAIKLNGAAVAVQKIKFDRSYSKAINTIENLKKK